MNWISESNSSVLLIEHCIEVLEKIQTDDVLIEESDRHQIDKVDIAKELCVSLISRYNVLSIVNCDD